MKFFKEIRMKVFIQIYYILRIFTKVNNKRILFEAYWGKSISCNPKAMMDYMIENGYNDYENACSCPSWNGDPAGNGSPF